jgi:hypothetical protein
MKIAYFTDTFAPEINGVANTLTKLSSYLEKKNIHHVFFAPIIKIGTVINRNYYQKLKQYIDFME